MKPLFQSLVKLAARGKAAPAILPPRPEGDFLWLHLAGPRHITAAMALAERFALDHGLPAVVTAGFSCQAMLPNGCVWAVPPADSQGAVQSFLAHWSPKAVVMIGASLRPVILAEAKAQNLPLILAEAETPDIMGGFNPFSAGALRKSVLAFDAIMAVDETSARAYRKLGANHVQKLGRIQHNVHVLHHNEPERAALATIFATRPVWLAVDVPIEEEASVIAAHRAALRLAHRLLLIFIPQNSARAPILAQMMEDSDGWIVARRDLEQDPDPETSVYIADYGQEYGLWYRLAPTSFMGGSLLGAGCARSPMEPAALGSAIIHGRKVGGYGAEFGRLGAALATSPVGTPLELAEAVADLLAPDRAARLAHAAWVVTSDGAEAVERIVQMAVQLARKET